MPAIRSKQSVFVGAVVLLSLVYSTAISADWGKVSDEEWAAGAPVDYPQAQVMVLFSEGDYSVSYRGIEMTVHVRLKILTAAGVEEAGEVSIEYWEDEKIVDFNAHTILPGGEKVKVDKGAVVEKRYRGRRIRSIAFPALAPGCIAEYKCKVASDHLVYPSSWYFQGPFYTLRSRLSLRHLDDFEYSYDLYNVPSECREPKVEKVIDARTASTMANPQFFYKYTWEVENLRPLKEHVPYASYVNDYRSSVKLQLASVRNAYENEQLLESWPKLGDRLTTHLVDEYSNTGGDVKRLAKEIAGSKSQPAEISQALYEYVCGEFQTTADYRTQFSVNDKMSDLLQKRAGAGEEKNLLLVQLHRALGIEALPVLIGTRDFGRFDPNRPGVLQFNYLVAFVHIDSSWEFLDAASRYYPYGILTPNCLTGGGLLLEGDKSDLVKITIRGVESVRVDSTRMVITPDGNVQCSTKTTFTGYTAARYAEWYDSESPIDFFEDYYARGLGPSTKVVEHSCGRDSLDDLIARVVMTTSDLVENLEGNLIVKPATFTFRENPFESSERDLPVDFVHPSTFITVTEILPSTVPESFILPSDTSFQINGAMFTRRCASTGSSAVIETVLSIGKSVFSQGDYSLVREFFAQVAAAQHAEVALPAASGQ